MRKFKKALALTVASCMAVTTVAVPNTAGTVKAEENAGGSDLSYDGYNMVWSDEFEGDSLNRDSWNVELHDKGWVNNELQAYVDSEDNIKVKDGNLVITPVKNVEVTGQVSAGNLLENNDFSNGIDGWEETIAIPAWGDGFSAVADRTTDNGAITYKISDPGSDVWHIQLKQTVSLEAGKTYIVTYKVKSNVARTIMSGVQGGADVEYAGYGNEDPTLEAGVEKTVSFTVTSETGNPAAALYFSLGKGGANQDVPQESEVTISDISFVEAVSPNVLNNSDFSDGINGWEETIAIPAWGDGFSAVADRTTDNGAVTYKISDPGSDVWHIQLKQTVNLEAGKTYTVKYKVKSNVDRTIMSGVQGGADVEYAGYGNLDPHLEAGVEKEVSFDVTSETGNPAAALYFSLGKGGANQDVPQESEVTISDIQLIDNSKVVAPGKTEEKKKVSYTSGRISTQNLETFTYGLFEARVKVPEGAGYLPAFWLMANDENIYGQWPKCGEIDCMEVMGQETDLVYGTIHYGDPHEESQGTYKITSGKDFSEDFHTFSCEWEPGKITWYVDGIKYHEESFWYSSKEGQGTLTYPAPFDQPFYIILNLAVGGSWVGNVDENTFDANNDYVVDYVRVYQKDEYNEDVTRPEREFVEREPDAEGNYINNGKFAEEDLTDDADWKFLTALEGDATAEFDANGLKIETANEGTVDYSVQLVQAGVPLVKGATYKLSYTASAASERTMNVDIKAPDHGYSKYIDTQSPALKEEPQKFEYTFVMKSDSDANARLEFNMGAMGSTADINLADVSIVKLADPDPDAKEDKTVLADGNYIYNGAFQEGEKHLGYWDITPADANVTVSSFSDGRRFVSDGDVTISQSDLAFEEGNPYEFSINAIAKEGSKITVTIGGNEYPLELNADGVKHDYVIKLPSTVKYADKSVSVKLEGAVSIDDVRLTEAALIKNGKFNAGTSNFTVFVDSSASASHVVDSLKEDNALSLTVNKTGDADWKVQIKQDNVLLEQGKTYKLKFDAKSSIDRQIRVIMQGVEALGWPIYSNDNEINLTSEWKTFEETFTMENATDKAAFLSICLGKITEEINDQHVVCIDNISLEEVVERPEIELGKIEVEKSTYSSVIASVEAKTDSEDEVEYSWYLVKDEKYEMISDWSKDNTLSYSPEAYGEFVIAAKARYADDEESAKESNTTVTVEAALKGTCQLPAYYALPGVEGYLIGIESVEGTKAASVEMLILDCSTMQWVYSTGRCGIVNNSLWTVWNPQYGYYWTLFRVYDENGTIIDEECYGFANVC